MIVGVGNILNGDDGAGLYLTELIQNSLPDNNCIRFIHASIAPENFTGSIKNFSPDWIWLMDAADFGFEPGQISIIDWNKIENGMPGSHSLPLSIFANYLKQELSPEIILFGIQPENISPFSEMSNNVKTKAKKTSVEIINWIQANYFN